MRRPPLAHVLLLALALASPAMAQSTRKPWALTLEERIALRTNAESAQERVRSDVHAQASSAKTSSQKHPFIDSFDGKTHPELFLPHEVFDELIKVVFSGTPRECQTIQDSFMADVKRHGLPSDFWRRLQSLSTIYVADLSDAHRIGVGMQRVAGRQRERAEETLAFKHTDLCRSRADALAASRKEFGRERFDRFLYDVIAVNMFYAADRLPYADLLLKAEEGCR